MGALPENLHGGRWVHQGVRKIWVGYSLRLLGTSPSPVCARLSSQSAGSLHCVPSRGANADTGRHRGDLEPASSSNPKFANFLGSALVDDGISGVGLAVFGMVVSLTGYRKGEKWAWYVSWSMPIGILAAQLNVYALTGSIMVIYLATVFTIVSLLALLLPFRQFFPRKSLR